MATARPFAYNPPPNAVISGTIQVGDLAIGTPTSGFTSNPQFWNGPDEELGYVIAYPVSGGTHPTPISGVFSYLGFLGTKNMSNPLSEATFVELTNSSFNQNFTTGNDASTWLTSNGYWNSWVSVTPTPTATLGVTPTPTSTVTPTITPTTTITPTPTSTLTPTPSVTNTQTPTITPTPSTTPSNVTGYSFNLVVLPYNFPTSGNTIMVDQAASGSGTTNPNVLASQGNAIYFNAIDTNGIDRTSYFSSFVGQSITMTMSQTGSTAIYSGSSTAFQSWSNSGSTGYVLGYGIAQSGFTSGTTVLVQSASTPWVTGQTVTISAVSNGPSVTPTPTPTAAGAGSWYFYSAENSGPGAPTGNGNALFFVGGLTSYNPNYVGGLQIYFNVKDSTGTDYSSAMTSAGYTTTGGTISMTQNGNTATYTGITGALSGPVGSQFLFLQPNSSVQQTVVSAVPFVSGSPITLTFSSVPASTPTPTPTNSPTPVTPTPTPTNTVTPTVTPSITPTNTETPTPTPTITPTNTVTPTITPSSTPAPNQIIVAAGGVNVLSYSYDGDNWVNSSNGATFISQPAPAVAASPTTFVAGGGLAGSTTRLIYSNDGITWSASTNSNTLFNSINGIAFGGGKFVAVGINTGATAGIAYSTDGITWTASNSLVGVFGSVPTSVAYNGSRWVATAQATGGSNTIAYSDDAITWVASSNGGTIFTGSGRGVAWGSNRWVAVGTGTNRIAYSNDGITWSASTSGNALMTGTGYGIGFNGTQFVACGQGTNALIYSNDGITWTASANGNTIFSFQSYCVVWDGNQWIAGGQGTNQLAKSNDGITWSSTTNGNTIMNDRVLALSVKETI